MNNIETKYYEYIDKRKGKDVVMGFLAQEVEKVLPVAVKTVKSREIIYDSNHKMKEVEIDMKKLDKTKSCDTYRGYSTIE